MEPPEADLNRAHRYPVERSPRRRPSIAERCNHTVGWCNELPVGWERLRVVEAAHRRVATIPIRRKPPSCRRTLGRVTSASTLLYCRSLAGNVKGLHPGFAAAKDMANPVLQRKAYTDAMRAFQNRQRIDRLRRRFFCRTPSPPFGCSVRSTKFRHRLGGVALMQ